jgi:carboxyl-terminal processing protease
LTLTAARYLTPSGRSIQRDYSAIDTYDYFNHKTAAIEKPFFEARTVTDRRVHGGDGIQPDEPIKSEAVSDTQAALLDTIFMFSREAVNGRIAGQENYRSPGLTFGKRITQSDVPVSDGLMSAFYAFAIKNGGGKFTTASLRSESSFIRTRLRYNLALASFGSVTADQALIEDDPQVAKGIAVLPQARQLAQLAAKARLTASW